MSTPDRETPCWKCLNTESAFAFERSKNAEQAERIAMQAEHIGVLTAKLLETDAKIATLTAQADRQTRQLADCHGVIASLWATTNPDEATPDLVTDIEHILGFKSGDCQNSVCGQLLMAEQQVEQQAQEIADLRRAIWPTPEAWATARDFVLLAGAHREDSETVDRFEQSDDYGVHGGYAEAAIERAKQAQEITRLREALKALIMDADLLCDGFSGGAFDQCRRTLAKAKEALK